MSLPFPPRSSQKIVGPTASGPAPQPTTTRLAAGDPTTASGPAPQPTTTRLCCDLSKLADPVPSSVDVLVLTVGDQGCRPTNPDDLLRPDEGLC